MSHINDNARQAEGMVRHHAEIKKLARLEAARLVRQWQAEKVDSAAGVRALLRAGIERVALAAVELAARTWRTAPPTIEELTACPWWRFRGAIRRVSSTADTVVEHAPSEDRHDPGQAPWLDVPGRDGALPLAWFDGEWMPFAAAATGAPDPLHPNGACTCGGQGRCSWCHYGEPETAALKAAEEPGPAALDPPVIELAHPDDRPEGYRFSAEGGLALAVSPDRGCGRCGETGSFIVGHHVLGCPCVKRRAAAYVKTKAGGAA